VKNCLNEYLQMLRGVKRTLNVFFINIILPLLFMVKIPVYLNSIYYKKIPSDFKKYLLYYNDWLIKLNNFIRTLNFI